MKAVIIYEVETGLIDGLYRDFGDELFGDDITFEERMEEIRSKWDTQRPTYTHMTFFTTVTDDQKGFRVPRNQTMDCIENHGASLFQSGDPRIND